MKNRILFLLAILTLLPTLAACQQRRPSGTEWVPATEAVATVFHSAEKPIDPVSEEIPPESETEATVTDPVTEPVTEPAPPETDPPETTNGSKIKQYRDGGYTYYIDIGKYKQYICPENAEEYLILANREHPIGPDYAPTDLVNMKANKQKQLRATASYAYDAMLAEMKKLGVADSYPQSTYRDYALQDKLYNRYLAQERKRHPKYTEEQIIALVDAYSARPGTSDHQTGLAIDFSPISTDFESKKMYGYLLENAYKFGFILRFPKDKTDITGYMFESWHWRFVGRDAAAYIHEHGITLEEYLEEQYGGILTTE